MLRNEYKYLCNSKEINLIEYKIKRLLKKDEFSVDGIYTVHSLYFDDYTNNSLFDNDAGVINRCKWRIRYYNNETNYIKLEKKEKINGFCKKTSCLISKDEYIKIIGNDVTKILHSTDKKLLKEFCVEKINKIYCPKIIIDYERKAYVEPITNIRITIDKNISGSNETNKFLVGGYTRYPLQEIGNNLLEIKYDYILPNYIYNLFCSNRLNQGTFSKYYLGRKLLERK